MSRFITQQQHSNSCGPVSVMNALKWLGYSITYRDSIDGFRELGWDDGTACYDLSKMLNAYDVKFKLHKQGSVKTLEKILDRGNAAIVAYDWLRELSRGGHYVFIDFHFAEWFNAYNYVREDETGMFRKDTLDAYFYATKKYRKNVKSSMKWMPCIWEIIREDV